MELLLCSKDTTDGVHCRNRSRISPVGMLVCDHGLLEIAHQFGETPCEGYQWGYLIRVERPYRFASRQPHSSRPCVAELAIVAVAGALCQAVVVQLEDHDGFACSQEEMDDGSPLLLRMCGKYTVRPDQAQPMTHPQSLIKVK